MMNFIFVQRVRNYIQMGACQSGQKKKYEQKKTSFKPVNPSNRTSHDETNINTKQKCTAISSALKNPQKQHSDKNTDPKIEEAISQIVEPVMNDPRNEQQEVKELIDYEKKNKKITLDDFILLYTIGQGAFGKVFLGYLKGNINDWKKNTYAIKQMKKQLVKEKQLEQNLTLEKAILKESQSPFITRLYCAFRDDEHYYLVMQWAQGGDLYTFLKPQSQRQVLFRQEGEPAIRFILACVILSLEHLHSRNIIYADLKPQNVLLFEDGYCKLSDFGLSHEKCDKALKDRVVGTKMYFAPELVLEHLHTKQNDLWALGVVAYELSNFFLPFDEDDMKEQKYRKAINQGQRHRKWINSDTSLQLRDLINGLLRLDHRQRYGSRNWSEIKQHSFFKAVRFDWTALKQKKLKSPLLPILKVSLEYEKVSKLKLKPKIASDGHEKPHIRGRDTIDCWTENNSFMIKR